MQAINESIKNKIRMNKAGRKLSLAHTSITHKIPASALRMAATCVPSPPPSQLRKDKAFELQKFCKPSFCWAPINFSVYTALK